MTSSRGTNRCSPSGDEAREDRRDLHPREVLLAGLGVAHEDGQVQRQPGDVGEGVRRVHGQRREHGEEPFLELLLHLLLLVAGEVGPAQDLDVLLRQRRDDLVAEQRGLALHQCARRTPDLLEDLTRHQAGGRAHGHARRDPALQAGHPDHEELVEVRGEDLQVADPLEQRQGVVLGQLEHAGVEVQPRELAVQEPVLDKGRD